MKKQLLFIFLLIVLLSACTTDVSTNTALPNDGGGLETPVVSSTSGWQVLSESDNVALAPSITDPVSGALIQVRAVARPKTAIDLPDNLVCTTCDGKWQRKYWNGYIAILDVDENAPAIVPVAVYVEVTASKEGGNDPLGSAMLDAWQPLRALFIEREWRLKSGDAELRHALNDVVVPLGCRPGDGNAPTVQGWYPSNDGAQAMTAGEIRSGWLLCAAPDLSVGAQRFAWLPSDIGERDHPHDFIRVWEPARVLTTGETHHFVYPIIDWDEDIALEVPADIALGDVTIEEEDGEKHVFFSLVASPVDKSQKFTYEFYSLGGLRILFSLDHPSAGYYLKQDFGGYCRSNASDHGERGCLFDIVVPADAQEIWAKVYALEAPGVAVVWRIPIQETVLPCTSETCILWRDIPDFIRNTFDGSPRIRSNAQIPLICPGETYSGLTFGNATYLDRNNVFTYRFFAPAIHSFHPDDDGQHILLVSVNSTENNATDSIQLFFSGNDGYNLATLHAFASYKNGLLLYEASAPGQSNSAYVMVVSEQYPLESAYFVVDDIPVIWRLKCDL